MTHPLLDEKEIFNVARCINSAEVREDYLRQVCGDHAAERIRKLLSNYEDGSSFLESPAAHVEVNFQPPKMPVAIGFQIGPYKLRELLGEGGMGSVYVAEQTSPVKRKVALKIVRSGMATRDVIARFEAERQALAMMDHPNIAKVHDGGETETGQPYFVMELVQGLPVTEFCDTERLSTEERLKLFTQVCRAVQHAHQKGIIHRDLKPSNILVAEIDGRPVPKVIDFGVAKAIGQTLTEETLYTHFSQLVGTPLYMSPEQTKLGVVDVDTRSDIYSLGVLLYELLTGNTPFDSATLKAAGFDEMRRIIREDEPQRPSARVSTLAAKAQSTVREKGGRDARQLGESLKGELDWIVMTALEKDRSRRYESASALAEDIERFLRDETITARPASRWYRAQKFVRRNRALVVSSAAVMVALSLGVVFATAGLMQAVKQRDAAVRAEETAISHLEIIKREQADNQVLIELLSDMYPKSWSKVTLGKSRTVYESIEQLSAQIDNGKLKEHPRVEIRVRQIFADAYDAARDFDKARRHLYRALELAQQEFGETHLVVADIYATLADEIGSNTSEPPDPAMILQHAERAIAIYEELGVNGWDSNRLGHAWFAKAQALKGRPERFDEAVEAQRKVVELGGEVIALLNLGLVWMAGGDEHMDNAIECFDQALDMYRNSGDDRPDIEATVLTNKAYCLRRKCDLAGALEASERAWSNFQTPELENEPQGHGIALRHAEILFAAGKVDEAFQTVATTLKQAKQFGIAKSKATSLDRTGWLYFQLGDYQAAEKHYKKAIEVARDEFGEKSLLFYYPCFYLARNYEAWEKLEVAKLHYQQAQPILADFARERDAPVAYWGLARTFLATGDGNAELLKSADQQLQKAFDATRKKQRYFFEPALDLVDAKIRRAEGKLTEAIDILYSGLDKSDEPLHTMLLSHGGVPVSRADLEQELAQYLIDDGRTEEAHQVMIDAVSIRRDPNTLGEHHIQTILAEIRLGRFRYQNQLHDPDTAKELEESFEKLRSFSPVVNGVRRRLAQLLFNVYKSLDDLEEENKWRSELERLNQDNGTVSPASVGNAQSRRWIRGRHVNYQSRIQPSGNRS